MGQLGRYEESEVSTNYVASLSVDYDCLIVRLFQLVRFEIWIQFGSIGVGYLAMFCI